MILSTDNGKMEIRGIRIVLLTLFSIAICLSPTAASETVESFDTIETVYIPSSGYFMVEQQRKKPEIPGQSFVSKNRMFLPVLGNQSTFTRSKRYLLYRSLKLFD